MVPAPVDQRRLTELYTREAISFIENHTGEPFFLYFAHNFPHDPLAAGEQRRGRSGAGLYGDVLEEIDESIGDIVASLERTGNLEDTLIIISSDNGPWYQGNAGDQRGRKGNTFEGGMRVPFIAHWPARIAGSRVEGAMAMGTDLLPTVLDILELPPGISRGCARPTRPGAPRWRRTGGAGSDPTIGLRNCPRRGSEPYPGRSGCDRPGTTTPGEVADLYKAWTQRVIVRQFASCHGNVRPASSVTCYTDSMNPTHFPKVHPMDKLGTFRRVLLEALVCCALLSSPSLHAQAVDEASDQGQPTFEEQASELEEQIKQSVEQVGRLERRRDQHSGTIAIIFERRIEAANLDALASAHRLAELVIEHRETGGEPGPYRDTARQLLQDIPQHITARLGRLMNSVDLDQDIAELSVVEQVALEADREALTESVLALLRALLHNLELSEQLGLDTTAQAEFLERTLADAAANQSVALELAIEYEDTISRQLKALPQDAELTSLRGVAAERTARHNAALRQLVEMMDSRDMRVVEYRQQLLTSTGTVTTDIFDIEVLAGLLGEWLQAAGVWAKKNLPGLLFNALIFLIIVTAAMALARLTRRLVDRGLNRAPATLSQLLRRMIISVVGNLVLLLGILFGLAQLGISVGPLLAGLGIAGFIIGFALQDTLGNFASGLMILLYRPYDVGDIIETNGVLGKVSSMSLVNTTILTIDNQTLVLPNSKIWGDVIKNITAQSQRRVDMVFGIGYADDIGRAEKVLEDIVFNHSKVLDDPAPVIKLHTLNESSVDFVVRPWTKTEDYWDVYWDITRAVKMRFDAEDISIPFPQRDVHLFTEQVATPAAGRAGREEQQPVPPTGSQPREDDTDDQAAPAPSPAKPVRD